MARYDVRLVRRGISVTVDSADAAYQWLDDHAERSDPYIIQAVEPDGGVRTVDYGSWGPPPSAA